MSNTEVMDQDNHGDEHFDFLEMMIGETDILPLDITDASKIDGGSDTHGSDRSVKLESVVSKGSSDKSGGKGDATEVLDLYEPKFLDIFDRYKAHQLASGAPCELSGCLLANCIEHMIPFCKWVRQGEGNVTEWIHGVLLNSLDLRPELRNGLSMILMYTFSAAQARASPLKRDMFSVLQDQIAGLGIVHKTALRVYNDPFFYYAFLKASMTALIDNGFIPENERQNREKPKKPKKQTGAADELNYFLQLSQHLLGLMETNNHAQLRTNISHIVSYWQHLNHKDRRNRQKYFYYALDIITNPTKITSILMVDGSSKGLSFTRGGDGNSANSSANSSVVSGVSGPSNLVQDFGNIILQGQGQGQGQSQGQFSATGPAWMEAPPAGYASSSCAGNSNSDSESDDSNLDQRRKIRGGDASDSGSSLTGNQRGSAGLTLMTGNKYDFDDHVAALASTEGGGGTMLNSPAGQSAQSHALPLTHSGNTATALSAMNPISKPMKRNKLNSGDPRMVSARLPRDANASGYSSSGSQGLSPKAGTSSNLEGFTRSPPTYKVNTVFKNPLVLAVPLRAVRMDRVGASVWRMREAEIYDVDSFLATNALQCIFCIRDNWLYPQEKKSKMLDISARKSASLTNLEQELQHREVLRTSWPKVEFNQFKYFVHSTVVAQENASSTGSTPTVASSSPTPARKYMDLYSQHIVIYEYTQQVGVLLRFQLGKRELRNDPPSELLWSVLFPMDIQSTLEKLKASSSENASFGQLICKLFPQCMGVVRELMNDEKQALGAGVVQYAYKAEGHVKTAAAGVARDSPQLRETLGTMDTPAVDIVIK